MSEEWAELSFRIPFDVGRLAPNRVNRMCWQERMRIADSAKEAGTLAWLSAGSPRSAVPVSVEITIRRARRLDPDALLAAAKPLLDSLFVGRITPDDSETWISFGTVGQEIAPTWRGNESILVRVTPSHAATADDGGCPAAALDRERDDSLSLPTEKPD